jgi:Fe-S oxidoreductase
LASPTANSTRALVAAADDEALGACTLHGECEAVCPKGIGLGVIARMNREFLVDALATWWRGAAPSRYLRPTASRKRRSVAT